MMILQRSRTLWAAAILGALLSVDIAVPSSRSAHAQTAPVAAVQPPLKAEQIDQLLAPVALYPDALLAQVFMASTYPLEIVQAARWVKSNPGKSGKALEDALQSQPWDASVKSLTAVPQVLQMMDDKLEWVQQLGDAFLAQREEVMNGVQRLRAKATAAGQLQTTKEQKVEKQTVANKTVIVIEPVNPQVVYVPVYNPTLVYGAWAYPAYPPYAYYPPGYVAGRALAFTTGVAVGAALWGNCNWGGNDVNINVNKYNSFNKTNVSAPNWNHDPGHRQGVAYRNPQAAQQYGRGQANVASREDFRGRTANAGPNDLQPGNRSPGNLPSGNSRPNAGISDRTGNPGARSPATADLGNQGGRDAFSNVDRGGAARADANRGRASAGPSANLGGARQGAAAAPRGGAPGAAGARRR